jgi:hypothetical protein
MGDEGKDQIKNRIESALEKYCAKEAKLNRRKNQAPEEEVVSQVIAWCNANGWFIKRYESKAKYINGVWRVSGLQVGTPDLMGATPDGYIAAIECKAPGRRSCLRTDQEKFLRDVLRVGGFGVVVDSVSCLERLYARFVADRRGFCENPEF